MEEELKNTEEELQEEDVQTQEEISQEPSKEDDCESKIEELEQKLKEAEDNYIKTHADFENIKKRLEREKYQAIDYASEKFAKDLLAPIDTLEMALTSADANGEPEELLQKIKEGIELTIKSFRTAFEKHGIELVDTDGEFNPEHHDAIMHAQSQEHEEGQIVQVMQKGYMYKDRLLRPAMVSICKKD
jgi:molecular chaperone GrpE